MIKAMIQLWSCTGMSEFVQPDPPSAVATSRRTLHVMLSAGAPHAAVVRMTITPDHFEEIIWSR